MLTLENGESESKTMGKVELESLVEVLSKPRTISKDESVLLEDLSKTILDQRNLSTHAFSEQFTQVFEYLVKNRLETCELTPIYYQSEHFLRILIWIKIFIRDPVYQRELFSLSGVKVLSQVLSKVTRGYLNYENEVMGIEVLKVLTNIFQKLCVDPAQRLWLTACNVPHSLTLLLCARDLSVLNCALFALIDLARSDQGRVILGELNCVETLLHIIQDYTSPRTKQLSSELLRQLCSLDHVMEQVKVFDGIPLCLSVLQENDLLLQFNLVTILERLSSDNDSSSDIRELGGIPIIITLIQDQQRAMSKGKQEVGPLAAAQRQDSTRLLTACCAALTQLALNDTNAHNIVASNGVYTLGKLILIREREEGQLLLQKCALRALRFLFSMERNRQIFKRMFPPDLFEMFIDVGHYVTDIEAYKNMVHYINTSSEELGNKITCRVHNTNKQRAPLFHVGPYAFLEMLGAGAFGCVYKIKKTSEMRDEATLAMKVIPLQHPGFGANSRERTERVGNILNESSIIKEQMRHPNIVRYYKAFKEDGKLYIVMQHIDGAPLSEHFSSLREKGLSFGEERIWKIFVQMVLALRYLHCDKGIVHRDLTPNNIMLGDGDKVTLTDFGLSKQKEGLMRSVVGTILYSCPELVKNEPYSNKADVWAIGCLLYQLCTLDHPFFSSGLSTLGLAKNIVEAIYDPLSEGEFSAKLISTVRQCLTAEVEDRPDIVGVGSSIASTIMRHMDEVRAREITLEKKLHREKKRVQKHHLESNKNLQNYQRLFLVTQQPGPGDSAQYMKTSARSSIGMSSSAGEDSSEAELSPLRGAPLSSKLRASRTACSSGTRTRSGHVNSDTRSGHINSGARSGHVNSGARSGRNHSGAGERSRRASGAASRNLSTATISISQRKVKQIDDPVLQILNQIHKIIFVSQLPPALTVNPKRRVIDKYKRALFSRHIGSINLKNEIKKLMEASKDIVDLSFSSNLAASGDCRGSNSLQSVEGPDGKELTYEQLQSILENCLVEAGYYELEQGVRNPLPGLEQEVRDQFPELEQRLGKPCPVVENNGCVNSPSNAEDYG